MVDVILQRQLELLTTFVRQRQRSTGQRATATSDSWLPLSPAREDRSVGDDGAAEQLRVLPHGVDDLVTAGHDTAQ